MSASFYLKIRKRSFRWQPPTKVSNNFVLLLSYFASKQSKSQIIHIYLCCLIKAPLFLSLTFMSGTHTLRHHTHLYKRWLRTKDERIEETTISLVERVFFFILEISAQLLDSIQAIDGQLVKQSGDESRLIFWHRLCRIQLMVNSSIQTFPLSCVSISFTASYHIDSVLIVRSDLLLNSFK